jgi:thiol:disulfide interchange protein DsbD
MRRIFILLALCCLATPGQALESTPVRSARATVTLLSDTDQVLAGQKFQAGLRIILAPGWHTYNNEPGDAGAPPELNFSLPPGNQVGLIQWPPAETMREGGLVTHGYTGSVVLPVTITPASDGINVTADATWLVCEKICVPEQGHFSLTLAAGPNAPSAEADLFSRNAPTGPAPSPGIGLALLLALAGGLLLNVMPCVFPVLAMKAMALTRMQTSERRTTPGFICWGYWWRLLGWAGRWYWPAPPARRPAGVFSSSHRFLLAPWRWSSSPRGLVFLGFFLWATA